MTAFHLFDALVAPVLLYGSEIWGCYGKAVDVDTMQLSFIKRVLRLPPASDTLTVLAESGRLPMQIQLIESHARYWECLYSLQDSSRLLHLALTEHLELMEKQKICWGLSSTTFIRKICDITGFDPPPSAAAVRASAQ